MKKNTLNKKLLFIVIFLVFFSFHNFGDAINICSWNLNKHYNQEISETVSNFAKNDNIDIFCLQEVRLELITTPDALYKTKNLNQRDILDQIITQLKQKTKKNWKYVSSGEYAIRKNFGEFNQCPVGLDNAIVYNSDKFEITNLITDFKLNDFVNSKECYRTDKNNIIILEVKSNNNTNNPFILINIHLPFSEREVDSSYGESNFTRDINVLWNIYQYELLKENLTLIAGDFNLPNASLKLYSDHFSEDEYLLNEPTTISAKYKIFNQPYDHFILEKEFQNKIENKPSRAAKIQGNLLLLGKEKTQEFTIDSYRKLISDHVPIIISIDP